MVRRARTARSTSASDVGSLVLILNPILLGVLHVRLPLVPAPDWRAQGRAVRESPVRKNVLTTA